MNIKQKIHRVFHRMGWELQRLENASVEFQAVKDVLRESRADVVLDVGANTGQFGDLVLETGFKGMLISFEAIPSVHARLAEHARRTTRSWVVGPCSALGSNPGETLINVSANSVSSSLLPMRREHLDAAPESAYVGAQTVQVRRLDDLADGLVPREARLMIKIDTQGYELEVLKGATRLLPRVSAIQLELSLVPLYQGAPAIVDAIGFVESLGFGMFSIVPGFKDKRSGRLLQVDGFFVRRPEGISCE